MEWCGAETDLRPVCKIRDFFPLLLEKDLPLLWNKLSVKPVGEIMVLPRLLRSGDLWFTEAAIHYILGDTRMVANLLPQTYLHNMSAGSGGCLWSLQFPRPPCVRRAFCSLLAGLQPLEICGETPCAQDWFWKWTLKSAEKGDELINKEASFISLLLSPGRIPRHNNEICLSSFLKLLRLKVIWQGYFDPYRKSLICICVCSPLGQIWKNKNELRQP